MLFDVDQSEFRPDAEQALTEVLAVLLEYPEATLLIEGHTDASGTPEHNRELSEARAVAVREWLKSRRGAATWRFEVVGHGERRPVASNDTREGRQQNRRVEITILRTVQRQVGEKGGALGLGEHGADIDPVRPNEIERAEDPQLQHSHEPFQSGGRFARGPG